MSDIFIFLKDLLSFDSQHPLLFTQFNFWAFFLLVFAGFSFIVRRRPDNRVMRNAFLFAVSLFFYFKTSGLFVMLLIFSTLLGWWLGIRFDALEAMKRGATLKEQRGIQLHRKWLMILGVSINLLVLFYFKYAYFFTDIYNTLFHTDMVVVNHLALWANNFTGTSHFDATRIILPVGISFFTFQNISYIVDVYKRKIGHVSNILNFGFYTTFFPQLVAGPIVRADKFVPQLERPYHVSRRQFGIAIFWILNGLMKKIILSDYLAVNFVDLVFEDPTFFTPFANLSALFIYSLQVYADFSGYTDIAIGVAMLMGFTLPKNFNSPYKATNAAGFWKRWHISLSNWLKDYLYIPLGGNRNGTIGSYLILGGMLVAVALMAQTTWVTLTVTSVIGALVALWILRPAHRKTMSTNINNFDTMLLGGMWHGASFNFITWGALNGGGILIYKWWKPQGAWVRVVSTQAFFLLMLLADIIWPCPALNVGAVWTGVICVGTAVRYLVETLLTRDGGSHRRALALHEALVKAWNIFLTFVFITFTRLFFRAGSNLPPAEANALAWNTAKKMVHSIGSHWNIDTIGDVVNHYKGVFIVFVIGMIIHWLPERWKRTYRILFSRLPLWAMAVVVVVAVMFIYQFITAELQPFIYFQF